MFGVLTNVKVAFFRFSGSNSFFSKGCVDVLSRDMCGQWTCSKTFIVDGLIRSHGSNLIVGSGLRGCELKIFRGRSVQSIPLIHLQAHQIDFGAVVRVRGAWPMTAPFWSLASDIWGSKVVFWAVLWEVSCTAAPEASALPRQLRSFFVRQLLPFIPLRTHQFSYKFASRGVFAITFLLFTTCMTTCTFLERYSDRKAYSVIKNWETK